MHRKHNALVTWSAAIAHYAIRLAVFATATALVAMLAMILTGQSSQAATRPYWNGRSPAVWTSPVDPMCVAKFHGRHGWIKAGTHHFRAVCRAGQWDLI